MCALVTGVQTCALPIRPGGRLLLSVADDLREGRKPAGPLRPGVRQGFQRAGGKPGRRRGRVARGMAEGHRREISVARGDGKDRSEEHTSELQSLMRISYAVFCLKKKKKRPTQLIH